MSVQPNPLQPVLRDYRASDLEELWRIDQQCFAEGISYSRRELEFYLRRPRAITLVAEADAKIVGFIIADLDRRSNGHVITIDVLPNARRGGLGSTLMEATEQRLIASHAKRVYLETAVDNAAALAFYKRHGYSVTGTIPRYYLDSIDALVMEKLLPALPR
ncbi:MAG: GNAT family N-acetyltransferase [Burkholderiales bacterium]